MACSGLEFCKLAFTETRVRAQTLVPDLEARLADLDAELDAPVSVHVNGCPNSCARIQVADIGFKGQLVPGADGTQVEGFQVHLGGSLGLDSGFGRKLRGHKVTTDELGPYVERVVRNFAAEPGPSGERFAQWAARADEDGAAMTGSGVPRAAGNTTSARRVVHHCPYCGDEDLRPDAADGTPLPHGGWRCGSCRTTFRLTRLPATGGQDEGDSDEPWHRAGDAHPLHVEQHAVLEVAHRRVVGLVVDLEHPPRAIFERHHEVAVALGGERPRAALDPVIAAQRGLGGGGIDGRGRRRQQRRGVAGRRIDGDRALARRFNARHAGASARRP